MRRCLLFSALLLLVCACRSGSLPPRLSSEKPAPLEGTFVSDADTLFFGGEGRGIHWQFAEAPQPLEAKGQGICVFLFHNEEYRYDAAESFVLRDTQGRQVTFLLSSGPASEQSITLYGGNWPDGKTFTKKEKL